MCLYFWFIDIDIVIDSITQLLSNALSFSYSFTQLLECGYFSKLSLSMQIKATIYGYQSNKKEHEFWKLIRRVLPQQFQLLQEKDISLLLSLLLNLGLCCSNWSYIHISTQQIWNESKMQKWRQLIWKTFFLTKEKKRESYQSSYKRMRERMTMMRCVCCQWYEYENSVYV